MPASSSSSSEDEQLAALKSVAVSFDDVTSAARKAAAKGQQFLNRKRDSSSHQGHGAAGTSGAGKGSGDEADNDNDKKEDWRHTGPEPLDAVQLKIAALLNKMLEEGIQVKEPKKRKKDSAGGGEEQQEGDVGLTTFRFFRRVKKGTPCVLDIDRPDIFIPTTRPDLRMRRDPTRALDADAKAAKRALKALAVDGAAIAASIDALPRPKPVRVPVAGVVLEGRPHVDQTARIHKLLGTTSVEG